MFEDGNVTMEQIQILSHQTKIAQRIELFVGQGASYETASFQRLGCVVQARAGRTQSRAAPVPAPGSICTFAMLCRAGDCSVVKALGWTPFPTPFLFCTSAVLACVLCACVCVWRGGGAE